MYHGEVDLPSKKIQKNWPFRNRRYHSNNKKNAFFSGERGGGRVACTAQDCRGAQGACAGDLHDDTDDNDDDDDDEYIYVMVVMLMMMILKVKGLVESEEERQGGGSAKATPVKIQNLI